MQEVTPHPSARQAGIRRVVETMAVLSRDFGARAGRPFGQQRLRAPHLDVLFRLTRGGPMPMTELALGARVTRGAISQVVEPLRAAGLIEVRADPKDRRSRIVRLTRTAQDDITRFEAAYVERIAADFAALTDEEVATLAGLLDRVREGPAAHAASAPGD